MNARTPAKSIRLFRQRTKQPMAKPASVPLTRAVLFVALLALGAAGAAGQQVNVRAYLPNMAEEGAITRFLSSDFLKNSFVANGFGFYSVTALYRF